MRTFFIGKRLESGDMSLMARNEAGALTEPAYISYSIFRTDGGTVLVSAPRKSPAKDPILGSYYVDMTIPSDWSAGTYKLIWYLRQYDDSSEVQVEEDFYVVAADPARSGFEASSVLMAKRPGITPKLAEMIMAVRELLSDTNPDRNYHFRPPTSGKIVAGYTSRVGFIWTDETIIRMLKIALSQINTANPLMITSYNIDTVPDDFANAAALGAASKCLSAEAARWAADEFGYSLNGVSLDLNKAESYRGLAEAYKAEFFEWLPNLTATKPYSAGLRQHRYLI